jgi:POT family proton-dependent oligopeptide transporter
VQGLVATSPELKLVFENASEKRSHINICQEPDDINGLYEGVEFPTEHEMATLRRVSDAIPLNTYRMYYELSVLLCVTDLLVCSHCLRERFSYYGFRVVFISYSHNLSYKSFLAVSKTHLIQFFCFPPGSRTGAGGYDGQSGVLGMQQTGLTTFW